MEITDLPRATAPQTVPLAGDLPVDPLGTLPVLISPVVHLGLLETSRPFSLKWIPTVATNELPVLPLPVSLLPSQFHGSLVLNYTDNFNSARSLQVVLSSPYVRRLQ